MRKEIMQALQQEYEQQRLKNSQEEMRRRQDHPLPGDWAVPRRAAEPDFRRRARHPERQSGGG